MNRSLIVARIVPNAEERVAEIFAESDRTDLPHAAGVLHRSLWRLGDLYVHMLETEQVGADAVETARRRPEFARVSEALQPYVTPYLSTWQSPKDAQAQRFYVWDRR
jgi:cyclase